MPWRLAWEPSEHQPPSTVILKEFSGILTITHTYLSGEFQEWEQNQQISQAVNSGDPQRSAKQSRAEICNLMSA